MLAERNCSLCVKYAAGFCKYWKVAVPDCSAAQTCDKFAEEITLNKENSYYPDTKDVFAFVSELNKYNLREVSSYALSQTLHEIVETLYDDEYLKELSVEYARNFIRKQISLSEAKELIDKAQKGSD